MENKTTTGNAVVWLQGIGNVKAKPAAELAVGDRTVWNYGYISRVVEIQVASPKFLAVTLASEDGNHVGVRRLRRDRLIAVAKAVR